MDPSVSGEAAEPIYRIKTTGKRISKEEFLKSWKKGLKPKEIKLEWAKGLAQKPAAEARIQAIEKEKYKPFARSRDDHYLDLGDNEKMKESGFIIPLDIPSHSWIRRGLDAAPNCYGIKPGRHWDGVDRSKRN
ncbi:hypothetical protein Salat_1992900 [Sesamum alatum]|uniref:Uncharacterized protein n=1 Tax=Sesamum alatum TaxID=300844 RepID=A0AAE2CFN1_9LAMI|nr:hypothetical protein Salat_1992900 [Sesamum alatum]